MSETENMLKLTWAHRHSQESFGQCQNRQVPERERSRHPPRVQTGSDLWVAQQTNWLDFTGGAVTNGGFSALVVFKADSVITNANTRNTVLVNHGNSAVANSFGLRFDPAGTMEAFLPFNPQGERFARRQVVADAPPAKAVLPPT